MDICKKIKNHNIFKNIKDRRKYISRRKSKPSVEIIPGYTAKQSQFIRGEITVDELDGRFFRHFLKNTIAAKDKYYIETAKNLIKHLI